MLKQRDDMKNVFYVMNASHASMANAYSYPLMICQSDTSKVHLSATQTHSTNRSVTRQRKYSARRLITLSVRDMFYT
jgi:hypothetical protein